MEIGTRVEILMLSILVEVITKSRFEWLNFPFLRFVEARLVFRSGLFATNAPETRLVSKFHHYSRVTCSVFKSYAFWTTILGQNPQQQPLCSAFLRISSKSPGACVFSMTFRCAPFLSAGTVCKSRRERPAPGATKRNVCCQPAHRAPRLDQMGCDVKMPEKGRRAHATKRMWVSPLSHETP